MSVRWCANERPCCSWDISIFAFRKDLAKVETSPHIGQLLLIAGLFFAMGFAEPKKSPVTVTLIAEHASVQPGGRTRIGVVFDIEKGWHIYAKKPGEAGLPTEVAWSAPDGVTFGPLTWPAHQTFHDPGNLRTFGYTKTLTVSSTVTLSQRATGHVAIPVHAKVSWLACKDICVPGSATLDLTLPVSAEPPKPSPRAEAFKHTH